MTSELENEWLLESDKRVAEALPDPILRDQILSVFALEPLREDYFDHETVMAVQDELADIVSHYGVHRYWYLDASKTSLTDQKRRLETISSTARKLRQLMAADPLRFTLCHREVGMFGQSGPLARDVNWDAMEADLTKVELEARALLDSPDRLAKKRRMVDSGFSPERALIWEPVFELVKLRHGKVPASRDGRVFQTIELIHATIAMTQEYAHIQAPEPESVYSAIRSFNSRGAVAA